MKKPELRACIPRASYISCMRHGCPAMGRTMGKACAADADQGLSTACDFVTKLILLHSFDRAPVREQRGGPGLPRALYDAPASLVTAQQRPAISLFSGLRALETTAVEFHMLRSQLSTRRCSFRQALASPSKKHWEAISYERQLCCVLQEGDTTGMCHGLLPPLGSSPADPPLPVVHTSSPSSVALHDELCFLVEEVEDLGSLHHLLLRHRSVLEEFPGPPASTAR
ncbi:hypothetical protein HaLaN_23921 [Haematococcus lacustris]|uniref:Uncharacterized protein n=1 Tax=Haematococcus lacustris TaxID=44745 RepID=A0A699ZU18_HAELA|nr:hypothetical protein HaLaN_23921 [Haematococcus lacustris]